MRLRPIGPGVGGLNYSSLLRDSDNMAKTTRAIHRLPRPESIDQWSSGARAAWQALVVAARRLGERFVEVRQAQAQAHIARTTALLGRAGKPLSRDDIGARYY